MVEKQQIDIKQISIRQVGAVKTILAKSGFTFENVKEDSTKDGYTTYGTFKTPSAIIVVRLSNHICSMKNWTERYKPKLIAKPKLLRRMGKNIQDPYKERCFFSIVFKAFDYSVNDSGSWKAICNEYVFNPIEVEEGGTIGKIANDAKGLNRGKPSTINGIQPQIREVNNENENLPKATDKIPQNISVDKDGNWFSTNGWGADYVSENKQYNTNTNMNKKLIRLTESDLHRIVKESVRHIVSEASATPNGFKHRFDPNKRDGDFPLEQPKWTKAPRWQGWQGEDPEWIMKQEKESGDPYYGNKQPVRVSEAQLHQIVKESVEQVLSEGLFSNLFKSAGQREFERRRKEAQAAYAKNNAEYEKLYGKQQGTEISDNDSDMNAYKIRYGTTAGYSPDWRERAQREMQTQRKAYLNGRSHY